MGHFNCKGRCIMPAAPELEEKIIKTKRALSEMKRSGKEMLNFQAAEDMVELSTYFTIINRPPKTFPDTLVAPTKEFVPILGVRKTIVLLVDFPDLQATQPKTHFEEMLFSVGSYGTGSMRDYYKEVSYGQLDVQGAVHGWFRAPQPKSYYTNNDYGFGEYPQNAQKLVEDVLDLADGEVDFSEYDNSGDDFIEAVVIIAAGSGGEQTGDVNDIWSHKWGITTKTVDGKKIDRYFMAPEDGRVGVMSHELGHLLMSWPDLYDIDYSSRGTGQWDLMAGGSWNNGGDTPAHPTAWCKVQAGWIKPTVVANNHQDIRISPYYNTQQVFKLPVNGNENSKEYFLLSNRKRNGFDADLPGEGLIIEHVDDNQGNNTDENHYLVDIEQADGLQHLNKNINSGDAEDPYPVGTNNSFTSDSTPSSKKYDSSDSQVAVTAIASDGNDILANVKVGSAGPQWINNVSILRTYASSHSKNTYIIVDAMPGWKKIHEDSTDGVTNIYATACDAFAFNRKVGMYIDENKVYSIISNSENQS